MTLAVALSRGLEGLEAPLITVEVHAANGLPGLTLVGLPDTEVREARDRVRAAILNSGFEFPNRRLTVNLAPADLPKESGRFDRLLPSASSPPVVNCPPVAWQVTNLPVSSPSPANCARSAAHWP